MAKKTKEMLLGLNCTGPVENWTITEGTWKGRVLSIEEAKAAWEAGQVTDYNLAFFRLVKNGWSMEAVAADFKAMDAARG